MKVLLNIVESNIAMQKWLLGKFQAQIGTYYIKSSKILQHEMLYKKWQFYNYVVCKINFGPKPAKIIISHRYLSVRNMTLSVKIVPNFLMLT